MPTTHILVLDRGTIGSDAGLTTNHVHALVCQTIERPLQAAHTAGTKAFSVGMLHPDPADPTLVRLPVTWLADRTPVDHLLRSLDLAHLGALRLRVVRVRSEHTPYPELVAAPPARDWHWQLTSPTYSSLTTPRNDPGAPRRRGLLPDPYLLLRGLTRRWNALADCADLGLPPLPDPVLRVIQDRTVITDLDLATATLPVKEQRTGPDTADLGVREYRGTVGHLWLRILGDEPTVAWFSRLTRFAAFAGLGAYTTRGFGQTRTSPEHGQPAR